MNTRHIQSFLIVSAAFFSMTGPVHARGGAHWRQPARRCSRSCRQDAVAQPSAERAVESKANAR